MAIFTSLESPEQPNSEVSDRLLILAQRCFNICEFIGFNKLSIIKRKVNLHANSKKYIAFVFDPNWADDNTKSVHLMPSD